MKISIVTACYNNKGTIDKCLTSVANQSYDNVEHVIIDGGSDDGTHFYHQLDTTFVCRK